eukprot:TRINITY_DN3501_c0_g1_i2.p2 TRINITY_DN3501_c0_g1~~TRINITY_DN3501_c0_g1_i2.p2  ORF type:complete len:119 (-),score=29.20 TRINITY_DN3501_c0_g1_i2:50-382(-)
MAAAELLASMFPDADANVLKAVLGASNDNVDMALTVLLEYTQALEQGAAAPSTEALEFLQGMFGDVDRAMIVAVDKLNRCAPVSVCCWLGVRRRAIRTASPAQWLCRETR